MTINDMKTGLIGPESKIQGIVTKLGIQGTPGLKFLANGQTFYIGRTGIFEIENIEIRTLIIEPVERYDYNDAATKTRQQNVIDTYKKLSITPYNYTNTDEAGNTIVVWDNNKIMEYHNILNEFIKTVYSVEDDYNKGLNGVYNKNPEGTYGTIIIDYEYMDNAEGGTINNE